MLQTLLIIGITISVFLTSNHFDTLKNDLMDTKIQLVTTQEELKIMKTSYEDQLNKLGASLDIGEPVPLFEDALASGISSSATSFTLIRGTDKTGTSLASTTYGFILSEGTPNEEFVLADCTGTACTNVVRGYWPLTAATSSALMKTHRKGDTVKITDSPIINQLKRIINGQADFPNALTFDGKLSYTTTPTLTSGNDIVYKAYVDGGILAGAATATESTTGISRLATALQAASSTPTTANTPYVLQAQNATSTKIRGCGSGYSAVPGAACVPVAGLNGYLTVDSTQQSWVNLANPSGYAVASSTATTSFQVGVPRQRFATSTFYGPTIGANLYMVSLASTTITGVTTPQPVFLATSTNSLVLSSLSGTTTDFLGFAVTDATNGASTTVQIEGIVPGFSGLTKGAKYYVSATGTISATQGTPELYVGRAISSTELMIEKNYDGTWQYIGTQAFSTGSCSGTCTATVTMGSTQMIAKYIVVVWSFTGTSGGFGETCSGQTILIPSAITSVAIQTAAAASGGSTPAACNITISVSGNTITASQGTSLTGPSQTSNAYFYR